MAPASAQPVIRSIDGPLGRWVHGELRPETLRGLVDRIWYFDGRMAAPRERVFPDGTLEVIVQVDGRFRDIHPAEEMTPRVCVTGVRTGYAIIEAPAGPVRVVGIRLPPPAAARLFAMPLDLLVDGTVDLSDVLRNATRELGDDCEAAGSPAACLLAAERWVLRRIAAGGDPDPAVAWLVSRIAATAGTEPIGRLREHVGWAPAKLAAAFREQVGITPKRLARIHRFRHALSRIGEGATSLSAVALAAGYSDQAHMNADFREFAGLSPGRYLAAVRYPRSLSLAEQI